MATLYTGSKFWDVKDRVEVTVRTDGRNSRHQWVADMEAWAKQRGIMIQWQGESTHTVEDDHWHEARFLIAGEHNRLMFKLAWSG